MVGCYRLLSYKLLNTWIPIILQIKYEKGTSFSSVFFLNKSRMLTSKNFIHHTGQQLIIWNNFTARKRTFSVKDFFNEEILNGKLNFCAVFHQIWSYLLAKSPDLGKVWYHIPYSIFPRFWDFWTFNYGSIAYESYTPMKKYVENIEFCYGFRKGVETARWEKINIFFVFFFKKYILEDFHKVRSYKEMWWIYLNWFLFEKVFLLCQYIFFSFF